MKIALILSAMFGIAFSATGFDTSQAGKKHCTYKGHKIGLGMVYQPPRECMELQCFADSTGKRVAELEMVSCGVRIVLIHGEKEKKFIKPQPSLDLKYPECCPTIYEFIPDDETKKSTSSKKKKINY
uniref:Single domain-containing protein n=1 Tax=Lygus hesperus TaxID=30085 RepID=A0A0A9YI89_LYGHE